MKLGRLLAIAILLAAAVVFVMLQSSERRSSDSPGSARSTASASSPTSASLDSPDGADEVSRTALATPGPEVPAAAAPASATGLRVRSAEGLALSLVEVEEEPGRWRDVALVDGVCGSATLQLPCRVRAPGHVAGMAASFADEVVLEADALLVLDGETLRECLRSIEFFAQYGPAVLVGFDRVATYGYTSPDRWAVAVSGAGTTESLGFRQQVDLALTDRTHRLIQVEFRATPGARGRWTVPCSASLDSAALDVAIVRPADEPRGELVCELRVVSDRDVLQELPQSWGRVVLLPGLRFTREGRVPANADRWQVTDVPLREDVVLTVMDPESRANGRLFFVHDGKPQRIRLHAGFSLVGRIAVPAGTGTPSRMRMCFGRPDGSGDRQLEMAPFSSDLRDVPIATDGTFAVRGPQRVPLWQEISADPPAELALEMEAPGFEKYRARHALGDAQRVDCGTIELVPSPAPIVLAPGSGFRSPDLDWKSLRIGPGKADSWTVRCGRVELDDSIALVFDWDWLVRNEPGTSRAFVSAPEIMPHGIVPAAASTEAFVIDIDGDRGRAFVRGPDGRYERVEEREYTIELVSYASIQPASNLTLSWSWRGIPQRLETLGPDRSSQRRTLRFTAPRDSARLCWSGTGSPVKTTGSNDPLSGSIALDRASATVEVP